MADPITREQVERAIAAVVSVWSEAYAAALSAEEARRAAKAKPPFDAQEDARKALAAGAPVQLGCVEVPDPLTGEPLYVPVPERPAARFKVGDWVRRGSGTPAIFQVGAVRDYGPSGYAYATSWCVGGIHEDALEPSIDPALRETARKTVVWLRYGQSYNGDVADTEALPGFSEWEADNSGSEDQRWADQLDALLGAPASPQR